MSAPDLRQRLAAILAADAAGYSRLMSADERATVAALDAARAVFRRHIEVNQGRVIDMAGDSVLAIFETAIGAVSAALAVQKSLREVASAQPEERRMCFRIGVHLGDVMEKADGTVYGDGVNIAARLQTLAEPGGITVSESVRTAVRRKVAAAFDDHGEQRVKNIAEPVRVFHVRLDGAAPVTTAAIRRDSSPGSNLPSIAVLPFQNMSGDPEQAYFSDGISEDIITDLSKLSGLIVIARNSSFAYRGKEVPTRQVGEELGVRYVLQGSVRRAAERVRISAQMVEASSGRQLWAERYDRKLTEMFELQDAITEEIVTALDVKLVHGEQARLWHKSLRSAEARDHYYQGLDRFWSTSVADLATARRLFEAVVRLEPDSPLGYVQIAWTLWLENFMGWSAEPQRAAQAANEMIQRALALDDQNPDAHALHGMLLVFARRHDEAITAVDRAVALGPNVAHVAALQAAVLMLSGQSRQAIAAMERAMRLCPRPPAFYGNVLGVSYRDCEDYDRAIDILTENVARYPDVVTSRFALVTVYNAVGRHEDARRVAREIHAIEPRFSLEDYAKRLPFRDRAVVARILEGLREARLIASA